MRLFLCSHFSSVGSAVEEQIAGKKVLFIPTASIHEGYTGYVGSARKLFKKAGALLTEIDISTEEFSKIKTLFDDADVIYFTGGNSFFLIDCLRKTGTDKLLKRQLEKGKLFIGESAGAIIASHNVEYGQIMDDRSVAAELEDCSGLGLVDYCVLPHNGEFPFVEAAAETIARYGEKLNLVPLNNREAVVVDGNGYSVRLEG